MAYPSNSAMNKRGAVPYVDFSIAAGGSSNECDVTVQFKESDGTDFGDTIAFAFWTCSDADGATPVDTPTSAHSDGGSGALIGALDDDKDGMFVADTSGEAVITVTDTAKSALYLAVRDPRTGFTNVSRVFVTADYA